MAQITDIAIWEESLGGIHLVITQKIGDFWPPPPILRTYYSKAWPSLLNELLKPLPSKKKDFQMGRFFVHLV